MRLLRRPDIDKLVGVRDTAGLAHALGDHELAVRIAAAKALDKLADPDSTDALLGALSDEDSRVRMHASSGLSLIAVHDATRLADPETVERLVAALEDPAWDVRAAVARTLGEIRDQRAFDPLVSHLDDPESYVRLAAVRALGELGDARAAQPVLTLFHRELDHATKATGYQWINTFAGAFDQLDQAALPTEARMIAAIWCERWDEVVGFGSAAVEQLHLMLSQAPYRSGCGMDHRNFFITNGERVRAAGDRRLVDADSVVRTLGRIGDPRSLTPLNDFRENRLFPCDEAALSQAIANCLDAGDRG